MDLTHAVLFTALIANLVALVIGLRYTRKVHTGRHETPRTELRKRLLLVSQGTSHYR